MAHIVCVCVLDPMWSIRPMAKWMRAVRPDTVHAWHNSHTAHWRELAYMHQKSDLSTIEMRPANTHTHYIMYISIQSV